MYFTRFSFSYRAWPSGPYVKTDNKIKKFVIIHEFW